jgi:negative regulator of flagellin synthesis FlgM
LSADRWIEYNRSKGTTVKIDSTTTTASTFGETRNRTTVTQPAAGPAAEVHLSDLAAQLQFSGDAPTFDASRVAEISQAIAEGRFTINAEAIADRLIASASELVGSQRRP